MDTYTKKQSFRQNEVVGLSNSTGSSGDSNTWVILPADSSVSQIVPSLELTFSTVRDLYSSTKFRHAEVPFWLGYLCILSSACGMQGAHNGFFPPSEWMNESLPGGIIPHNLILSTVLLWEIWAGMSGLCWNWYRQCLWLYLRSTSPLERFLITVLWCFRSFTIRVLVSLSHLCHVVTYQTNLSRLILGWIWTRAVVFVGH